MLASASDLIEWLRANPQLAIEAFSEIQPVGDWTVEKVRGERGRKKTWESYTAEVLVRRNHLGHVVAQVGKSWGDLGEKFPNKAFCAWMTYPLRAPHGLYAATVPECLQLADAEMQENPKCLLVNPRTRDPER